MYSIKSKCQIRNSKIVYTCTLVLTDNNTVNISSYDDKSIKIFVHIPPLYLSVDAIMKQRDTGSASVCSVHIQCLMFSTCLEKKYLKRSQICIKTLNHRDQITKNISEA